MRERLLNDAVKRPRPGKVIVAHAVETIASADIASADIASADIASTDRVPVMARGAIQHASPPKPEAAVVAAA